MATLRRQYKGKNFVVDFHMDGIRFIRSTKTADYKTAKIILKDIEAKIAKGTFNIEDITPKEKVSIKKFIEEYLKYSKAHKAYKTFLRDRLCFKHLASFIGSKNLDSIDQRMVENYLDSRIGKVSKSTINIELRHLKAAFTKAVQWDYTKKNPFQHVKEFSIPQKAPVFFTEDQLNKLLDHIPDSDKWLKEIITVDVHSGMRVKELVNLEWSDINFHNRTIKISNKKDFTTKSKRERSIPLHDTILSLLTNMKRKGNYVFANDKGERRCSERTSKVFKKYVRLAGLDEKFHFHVLRQTFASYLVQKNVSIYKVSKLLGHSDLKTTEVFYAHLAPENLHADVGLLDFGGQTGASGLGIIRKTAEK